MFLIMDVRSPHYLLIVRFNLSITWLYIEQKRKQVFKMRYDDRRGDAMQCLYVKRIQRF